MTARRQNLRRIGAAGARVGVVGSAAMLLLTILGMTLTDVPGAAAATDGGPALVVTPLDGSTSAGQTLTSGGSATLFSLLLPTGAACTGDSANDGFRVQSYMVPAAVDPNTLTFGAAGPLPSGGLGSATNFRQPLYEGVSTTGYVNAQTANASVLGGPGPVVNVPAFNLALYATGDVPPGEYKIGLACTKGTAGPTQLDKFWNAPITIVAAAADPIGIGWTATPSPTTTTTSSTTTSSTTTLDDSTTTTAGGSSTTTTSVAAGDGTTTTSSAEVLGGGGSPTDTSMVGSVSQLPLTGKSTTALVVWSVLLLVFGRMAVLLGRPPRVKPALRA
jgi:hypothetical protein